MLRTERATGAVAASRRGPMRAALATATVASVVVAMVGCSSDDTSASGSTNAPTTAPANASPTSAVSTSAATSQPNAAGSTDSAGCQAAAVAPGEAQVDLVEHLNVDGTPRYYLRHVPASYTGADPMPVVIDIHGYAEGAALHSKVSGFGALGETEGFITVSPHGQGAPPHWNANIGTDDAAVLEAIFDDVEDTLCVDTARLYVVGFSNGAFMTSALACEFADRIAAVAPVAGIRDVPNCAPSRPVPVITVHGTDDDFVSYDGGMGAAAAALPAPDGSGRTLGELGVTSEANTALVPGSMDQTVEGVASAWARRNGCEDSPASSAATDDVTLVDYACPANADVQLYRVEGGGHSWPGSEVAANLSAVMGHTTMTMSATETIWAFFEQHALN